MSSIFRHTHNKALDLLRRGKPIFVKVDEYQEIMFKKDGSMYGAHYLVKGDERLKKLFTYAKIKEELKGVDPFNFRHESEEYGEVVKIDFINKKRVV